MRAMQWVGAMLLAFALAGCNTLGMGPGSTGSPDSSTVRSGYGTVETIEQVDRGNVGVLGTVGGAVIGGLLGHQIGSGRGQTAATIAGAAGGAYAGREIERRRSGADVYKVYVRMDDGSYQAIAQDNPPVVRRGDRVRILNGVITPI
jgi:outer membrane lipoprotein SlyB